MHSNYLFRAGIVALAVALPGCLEIPKWHEPPADAGAKDTGSVSDTRSSGDGSDTGDGLDARVGQDTEHDVGKGEDGAPVGDAQSEADASDTGVGRDSGIDAGVPPDPCYRNSFDTIESLAQFVAQNGRWSIHPEGYLQQTQVGGGPHVGYLDIRNFLDNEVRLRVRIPQQEGAVFAQLLFRYTRRSREGYDDTIDRGYTLQIERDSRVAIEDFYHRRLAVTDVQAELGAWHELTLQVLRNQIVGFLNEKEVIRLTDETYSLSGAVGLSAHAGMVDFDDLSICPLERIVNPHVADASCVALFHFDEPNLYRNECIEAHTLSEDHETQNTQGRFGQARYFNGEAYLLSRGNITLDLDRLLTVEAWIKPDRAQDSYNGMFGNLVHSAYSNGTYEGFAFGIDNQEIWFVAGIDGNRTRISAPFVLPTDRFTHVAATYDGNHLRLYLNGEKVNEQATPGALTRITDPSAVLTAGADRNGLNGFIGAIDEVRISSVARY